MGDSSCMRRLAKELQQLMGEPPAGVKVEVGAGGEEAGTTDDMRLDLIIRSLEVDLVGAY